MGLSSSQARLLNLTARMHQIEYKAAKLEAQKLQMANESRRVYDDYLVALDATKIQMKKLANDGSIDYIDATYNVLMNAGYQLSMSGAIIVSQTDIDFFNNSAHGNANEFACLKTGYAVKDGDYTVLASDHNIGLAFNEAGLRQLATNNKNIALMDNITVNSSLGSYSGTLDGNGKTLTVKASNGAFSSLNNATIQNLNINADIHSNSGVVGALAANGYGQLDIHDVSVYGSIDAKGNAGGLIGSVSTNSSTPSTIENITIDITINSTTGQIGGVVANNTSHNLDISNVRGNFNSTSSTTGQIGGVLGYRSGTTTITNVSNCAINANINANNANVAGGIVGMAWDSIHIDGCYVTGSVRSYGTATGGSGGIIGGWGACASKGDGTASITNCYTEANISPTNPAATTTKSGDVSGLLWSAGIDGNHIITNTASINGTSEEVLFGNLHHSTFTEAESIESAKNAATSATASAGASTSTTYTPPNTSEYKNFYEIGLAIQEGRVITVDGMEDNPEWLTNMINGGTIILQKRDKNGEYYDTSVAIDTGLQEVADETLLRKAEAKYEADMRKIDAKDRKYDIDLAALDAERNAIKSEMETLNTVAKDNVERTFKLFS